MADKPELQTSQQTGASSLTRSETHSSLVARGRREASNLMKRRSDLLTPIGPNVVSPPPANTIGQLSTPSLAFTKLHDAAEMGDAKAQNNLGVIYEMAQGFPWGPKYFATVFTKLSDLYSSNEKLFRELFSTPISRDYAKAAFWYRKAAEQGFDRAQVNLGNLYSTGQGVPLDHSQAENWFQRAAEQGNAIAQCRLGELYSNNQGVPPNFEKAVFWLRKAADRRVWRALGALGLLYSSDGLGQSPDDAEAYYWFYLADACASASKQRKNSVAVDDRFSKAREAATSRLNATKRSEAEKRATQWLASHPTKVV